MARLAGFDLQASTRGCVCLIASQAACAREGYPASTIPGPMARAACPLWDCAADQFDRALLAQNFDYYPIPVYRRCVARLTDVTFLPRSTRGYALSNPVPNSTNTARNVRHSNAGQ
jgi:hypothetical protein